MRGRGVRGQKLRKGIPKFNNVVAGNHEKMCYNETVTKIFVLFATPIPHDLIRRSPERKCII